MTANSELDPMQGRRLDDRYTLVEKIGTGSMGAVYRARQHAMARDVAVKILKSEKALDATSKARFLREARANSLLTSPNTVTVFDFGQATSGELFLAMELLKGESLGARLAREKKLSPAEAVDVAHGVLHSLAEAHAKGLVHRDLKPDNIFFARVPGSARETVKVLDFGIAKFITGDGPINAIETQAGTVFGTPRYMSPEQAQGKPLDARSDLYSLGVILYHILTGQPPFTDDDAVIVMARHIKAAPRRLREFEPTIHPDLERAVLRALAKDPADRFFQAEEMLAALTDLSSMGKLKIAETAGQPIVTGSGSVTAGASERSTGQALPLQGKHPIWLWTIGLIVVGALVGAIVAVGRPSPRRQVSAPKPPGPVDSAPAPALGVPGIVGPAPAVATPVVEVSSLPKVGPSPRSLPHNARTGSPSASASGKPRYGLFE